MKLKEQYPWRNIVLEAGIAKRPGCVCIMFDEVNRCHRQPAKTRCDKLHVIASETVTPQRTQISLKIGAKFLHRLV